MAEGLPAPAHAIFTIIFLMPLRRADPIPVNCLPQGGLGPPPAPGRARPARWLPPARRERRAVRTSGAPARRHPERRARTSRPHVLPAPRAGTRILPIDDRARHLGRLHSARRAPP